MIRYTRNRLAQLTTHAAMAEANDRLRAAEDARVFGTPAQSFPSIPAPALPGRK